MLRHRALEFGLTNQAWGAYAVDVAKGLAVGVVATSIALVVLVGVARRWPRAWPAAAGLLLAGLVMLGSFVYPLLVEPLFNNFEPLPDGPLRTQVLALADQEGVQVDDVLVADASRRTTTLNAYVSGFGSSRRVVVYDNLVDDADDRQILSVVAHELGHARHDDVLTGSLLGAAGALFGVGLLGLLVGGQGRMARPAVGAPGAGARGGRDAARQPGAERHQPAHRDPGRRGLAAGHPATRRRSPRCRSSWRSRRWPTPRRTRGRSSGSAATRRRCSGSLSPSGSRTDREMQSPPERLLPRG